MSEETAELYGTACEPVLVENYFTHKLVMDCFDISSSISSDSIEGCLNVECSNNLVVGGDVLVDENEEENEGCLNVDCSNNLVDGGDVLVEENDGSVMEFEEEGDAESLSVNSRDMQDFLEGNDEQEATSMSISSLLDSVSSTGPPNVVVKEEIIVDDDQLSRSQPLLVSRSELSAIEAADARFEAQVAISDHIKLLEAAELKRISDQVLPQAPVSETSTDSSVNLTPLQEYKLKVRNDAYRLREERREAEEIQAFLEEQEFSLTQCIGYGVRQGHFVVNRVIEGLLPKIPSMQLTQNWLLNTENIFNISSF